MKATVELVEGDRLGVWFRYEPNYKDAVKSLPGSRYVPPEKGGPYWTVPADLRLARALREIFGSGMTLGQKASEWGRNEVGRERNLMSVSHADDATLTILPEDYPDLFEFVSSRTYQRADIAFMSATNTINANKPGLGKTIETVAAIAEAELVDGKKLVIAPLTSLETVWQYEIERFDLGPALIANGPTKGKVMAEAAKKNCFWLICTPDVVRKAEPFIMNTEWDAVVIDEFHKNGLGNRKTKFAENAFNIKAKRKYALSGTPIGGKPYKLWSVLHFLAPERFTSFWSWAKEWLIVNNNGWGMQVGGILPGREAMFYRAMAPYLIRRTKEEVAKDLPPKQYVDVWCGMSAGQKAQYIKFARDAEIRIDEEHLSATTVLAEYTRLKQFANARIEMSNGTVMPTTDSGKLQALLERLQEHGIGTEDGSEEQAVIATQFETFARTIQRFLEGNGIESVLISGPVKVKDRVAIQKQFQSRNGPKVCIITTTAGGVAITLDMADSVHIMDETWNPDDQEQVEDRIHRVSRIHNVTCYYYRTRGTIEEYIHKVVLEKGMINTVILDLRKKWTNV